MKRLTFIILTFLPCIFFSQIKNLDEENNYLRALEELAEQSATKHFSENDWDEGIRQHLTFDPMSMNLVFYKTPFDESDNNKNFSQIKWLTKSIIPLSEIDTLIVDNKKETIAIKTFGKKNSIQIFALAPDPQWYGKDYYRAGQDKILEIKSDKLLKIRNLDRHLNWHISQLQLFDKKKAKLVNFLNQKLKKEVEYQQKDPENYPEERKFKLIQDFQLEPSGQWLSIIVERKNDIGNPITEKQSVRLKDIIAIVKDINIILETNENAVLKSTTFINDKKDKETVESVDDLFFLQWCYERSNEEVGDEIIKLFQNIGQNIKKEIWYD